MQKLQASSPISQKAFLLIVVNWHNTFLINLIIIPTLIMVILIVPNTKPLSRAIEGDRSEKRSYPVLNNSSTRVSAAQVPITIAMLYAQWTVNQDAAAQ